MSNLATFIGGGGGCTGAGGGVGIDGLEYWNDCELQEEVTHASRIVSAARATRRVLVAGRLVAISVREQWRWILERGIDSSSG